MPPISSRRSGLVVAVVLGAVAMIGPSSVRSQTPSDAASSPASVTAARARLADLRAGMASDRRAVLLAMQSGVALPAAVERLRSDAAGPDAPPAATAGRPAVVLIGAAPADNRHATRAPGTEPLDALLDLIASAEAGPAGYDAIHSRARVLPAEPPTRLTLGEILIWIEATPGQPHAIGRYQIIPNTLRYLMLAEGLERHAQFTPALQDRLAHRLIRDAGLDAYLSGLMPPRAFMDKLAYVWAGLPLPDGRSAYEGIAGNRATLSRARYEAAFLAALPPPALLLGMPPGQPAADGPIWP
jgi:hypothetical protein